MINKIILCFTMLLLVSCNTAKSVVTTTRTPSKPIVRTIRKPIVKSEENPVIVTTKSEQTTENTQNQNNQTEILEATTRVKVTTAMVNDYIEKYQKIAKEDMITYGIPASITLGQGILESGAGTGPLSAQANNHFGIKCHLEWTGPSVKYDDDSAQECFRKYSNPEESYRDHSMFLTSRSRYSSLFNLPKNDYKSWAKGLKNAGYATDPAYPTKLIGLIERYNLQQYDAAVLGTDYVSTKNETIKKEEPLAYNTDVKRHEVIKGDTLYSLSKRYNISVEDIKKKNNISESGISIGQNLIIK